MQSFRRAAFPTMLRHFRGRTLRCHLSTATTMPMILWKPPSETAATTTVQLLSWGRGSSGQLGGGIEEIRFYPTLVSSCLLPRDFTLSPVYGRLPLSESTATSTSCEIGISCGLFHSSLLVDGNVWVWGKGDGGRLGLGNEDSVFVPTKNTNLDSIETLSLGGLHSVAINSYGEIFTWGYGGFGALGHSVYHRELLPRLVEGPWQGKISHVATSGTHTAAVTESGELYIWGRDEGEGRLGLGEGGGPDETGALATPTKVEALPVSVAAVSCGGFFTVALTPSGQLWSWGANSNFELGRGDRSSDWRPHPIPSLQDVRIIQVATGGYHSLALSDKGKVYSWGHGGHGQLGHHSLKNQRVPQLVEALSEEDVIFIACGGSSSAAVTSNGKLFMWGYARDCLLGVPGLPEMHPSPIQVNFLSDDDELGPPHVLSVAIGASHAMCLVSRPR